MREINVVGLDVDGKTIICESADSGEKFLLLPDGRLHAALRGDRVGSRKPKVEVEVSNVLRPKDIQARIRAGASVEQVAEAAGVDVGRVERFATRSCWSVPVPPSWPPRRTPCSPTGRPS